MCKWGIFALEGDPYSPTNTNVTRFFPSPKMCVMQGPSVSRNFLSRYFLLCLIGLVFLLLADFSLFSYQKLQCWFPKWTSFTINSMTDQKVQIWFKTVKQNISLKQNCLCFFRQGVFPVAKVCPIENNTNLNSNICLIKSSKIDFISLPAFYLIMWLMASPKNFEKIAILKKWQLVFYWGTKTYFGEMLLKLCFFKHEIFYLKQYFPSNSYFSHQM